MASTCAGSAAGRIGCPPPPFDSKRLENLTGSNIHNADAIHPEWQERHVGDQVLLARPDLLGGQFAGVSHTDIVALEPERMIREHPGVLRAATARRADAPPGSRIASSGSGDAGCSGTIPRGPRATSAEHLAAASSAPSARSCSRSRIGPPTAASLVPSETRSAEDVRRDAAEMMQGSVHPPQPAGPATRRSAPRSSWPGAFAIHG